MKHAGPLALDRLEGLLAKLRKQSDLKEKSRGIFYRKSRAFLHFHEHGDALYADVRRPDGEFDRMRIDGTGDWAVVIEAVSSRLRD